MSTLPAVLQDVQTALLAAQAATPPETTGDFLFLKMTRTAEWVYGADDTEVDNASAFVVDAMSYCQGFIAWYEGDVIDEQMAVTGQTPVTPADLRELPELPATKDYPKGAVWTKQLGFAFKGIEAWLYSS